MNKSLNLDFLKTKKIKIVSSENALKEVHPFYKNQKGGNENENKKFK